tara:strand:- start:331 stop:1512 length:1182 start_codon:yes stop_codon:yes gene_type:complete
MGKSAPPTPDYRGAAQETAEASKEVTNMQTYANRPDQVNPWGSTTWTNEQVRDPATGQMMTKWNQNQELAPDSKAALDSQLALTRGKSDLAGGMMGRVADEFGSQMDWDQFGDLNRGVQAEAIDMGDLPAGASALDYSGASAVGDSQAQRDRAEQAIFDRSSSRLNDRFGGQQQAMEIKLANQGLRPGDQAYDAEMKNLGQERNDAYSSAMNDAITGGGAEASRTFGMDQSRRGMMTGEQDRMAGFANDATRNQFGMDVAAGGQTFDESRQAGNFGNQARQQALGEQMAVKDRAFDQGMQEVNYANALRDRGIAEEQAGRTQSLNEMNAVLTGQQVQAPQMENFRDAGRAQGADYSGAMRDTYAADLNRTNASNMGMQGMMSGGVGLATGGFF